VLCGPEDLPSWAAGLPATATASTTTMVTPSATIMRFLMAHSNKTGLRDQASGIRAVSGIRQAEP